MSILKPKSLSKDELNRIKSQLNYSKRNDLLIALAIQTGARASELLAITPNSLQDDEQSVWIKGLKGSNDRNLPLTPLLYTALKRLGASRPNERLFPITYSSFAKIWADYRPQTNPKLHSLRHSYAIGLYAKTKDIRLVQYALGHRSLASTEIYTKHHHKVSELRLAM